MTIEIETADPKLAALPHVTPVPRPPAAPVRVDDGDLRKELAGLATLAAEEIRPHLLRYSIIALAVGFAAGRVLR